MTKLFTVDKTLSPKENDWLSHIPAKYQRAAFLCLKEMLASVKFNNSIERSKVTDGYMVAFVTAINLAHNPEEQTNEENDKSKSEENSKVEEISDSQTSSEQSASDFDEHYRSP